MAGGYGGELGDFPFFYALSPFHVIQAIGFFLYRARGCFHIEVGSLPYMAFILYKKIFYLYFVKYKKYHILYENNIRSTR